MSFSFKRRQSASLEKVRVATHPPHIEKVFVLIKKTKQKMLACFIKYLYIRPIRHELRKKIMKYVSRRICMKMNELVLFKSLKK